MGLNDPVRVCVPCSVRLSEYKTIKEVVVLRRQRVVHIYETIEHGRRQFRSLVFTTGKKPIIYHEFSYFSDVSGIRHDCSGWVPTVNRSFQIQWIDILIGIN